MNITCGKAKFNIPVKDTEEFPYLPKIVKDKSVLISQFTLKEVIHQTVFSISDNENTKVMTGELFEIKGSQLKVVSLDGHRISIRKVDLKEQYDDVSVIIPGKTLIEISKILMVVLMMKSVCILRTNMFYLNLTIQSYSPVLLKENTTN